MVRARLRALKGIGLRVGLGVLFLVLCAPAALWWGSARPYPVERLRHEGATSLTIVDRNGLVLRRLPLPGGGRAEWMPLAEIPAPLISALIAGEDRRFFS